MAKAMAEFTLQIHDNRELSSAANSKAIDPNGSRRACVVEIHVLTQCLDAAGQQ